MFETKFFFYGILMDYDPKDFDYNDKEVEVTDRQDATTLGVLYDLGPFPGAKFGGLKDIVRGKIVTFRAPSIESLQKLIQNFDHIESYYKEDEENSFYIRKTIKALTGGHYEDCQAYEFNAKHERLKKTAFYVPDGDWLKFKEKTKGLRPSQIREMFGEDPSDEEEIL